MAFTESAGSDRQSPPGAGHRSAPDVLRPGRIERPERDVQRVELRVQSLDRGQLSAVGRGILAAWAKWATRRTQGNTAGVARTECPSAGGPGRPYGSFPLLGIRPVCIRVPFPMCALPLFSGVDQVDICPRARRRTSMAEGAVSPLHASPLSHAYFLPRLTQTGSSPCFFPSEKSLTETLQRGEVHGACEPRELR